MAGTLSYTLVDARGRTTQRSVGLEDQVLLVDYVTAAEDHLTLLGAVSDLGVKKAQILIPLAGIETAAVALSNVDVGATFAGTLDTSPARDASHKVPGIKDALVGGDGTVAITGATAAYLLEFETGENANLAQGNQIADWIRGTLDK